MALWLATIAAAVPFVLHAQRPARAVRQATAPEIHFSATPRSVVPKLPPELANRPTAPIALTQPARIAALNAVRAKARLGSVQYVQPATVVLTPYAPKSGSSYYTLESGDNYPAQEMYGGSDETRAFSHATGHDMKFHFGTIAGRTYLIDLFVQAEGGADLAGVFEGHVQPQAGHVIVGFTANSNRSELDIRGPGIFFFRCEITRLD
jgi:hypothetical protein